MQLKQMKPGDGGHAEDMISIRLQINYEDTDAGGIVYYGNYLGYMERARNAYLRSLGYPPGRLANDQHLLFVVTQARVKYLSPGKLDDELTVTAKIKDISGARIVFAHQVLLGEVKLVCAQIELATLNSKTLKPCRTPKFLRSSYV